MHVRLGKRRGEQVRVLVVAGLAALPLTAKDADAAQPAPIAGQDVMGDKSRSGPDGWAQAPVTRDKAPAGQAAGQTAAKVNAVPNAQPDAATRLGAGQNPGTPAPPASAGPGTLDTPSHATKP